MIDITYYSWKHDDEIVYTQTLTPDTSTTVYDDLLRETSLVISSTTKEELAYIIVGNIEREWERDILADLDINNLEYRGWKNGVRVYYTLSETPEVGDVVYDAPEQVSMFTVSEFYPRVLPTIMIGDDVYTLDETQYKNPPDLIDPWRLALKYNQSPNIRKLYDGLGDVVASHSMWNFYKFFNVDEARGTWLDKVGELYNFARPYGLSGSAFLLDIDAVDDPTVVMDGFTAELVDVFYRTILKLRQQGNFTMLSYQRINDIFKTAFGEDKVDVDIEEGYMSFRVNLTFDDPLDVKILYTILETDIEILGEFPGVSYKVLPKLRGL